MKITSTDIILQEFRETFNLHSHKSNGEIWVGSQNGVDPEEWLAQTLTQREEEVRKEIEEVGFRMNVEEYLPLVKKWDGKNYDVPFEDGYKQAKKDILLRLSQGGKKK